jgi:AAA+ superfamily predicted ATPase
MNINRDAPQVELHAPQPYQTSAQHLNDELARVDLLVRAQVLRWRMTIGATKPDRMWGMVHVTDAEIDTYLSSPRGAPADLPESLLEMLRPFWSLAEEAGGRIDEALEASPPNVDLRVRSLCDAYQLSDAERDLVLVSLLPEMDFRYRRMFGYLQDDASRSKPPVELLLQIVLPALTSRDNPRGLFEPGGKLISKRLLVVGGEDEPRGSRPVRVDDRIASFLLNSDQPDERLRGLLTEVESPVAWDDLLFDRSLTAHLRELARLETLEHVPLRFHGPYGSGRERAARAICTNNGIPLLRADVKTVMLDPARWEQFVDLAYREALLRRAAIFWANVDLIQENEQQTSLWEHLLTAARGHAGITFLADSSVVRSSAHLNDPHLPRVDFPVPHYELRRRIWLKYMPAGLPQRDEVAGTLSSAFQFTEGQVIDAVKAARELAQRRDVFDPTITRDDLYEASRKQSSSLLLSFARRIEPSRTLTMDDLILADPNKQQLKELLNRIRLRSRLSSVMGFEPNAARARGLLTLFVGASGTGKTMSAELLASGLGVDLYKVDLAAVVSKWVGETEKNLNRIFAEAEDSNALLFFDECDALFGQRGEIKEAKDRWANLEVNYLLQRVEEYSGVVIMATNLRQNIDDAFLRRIQVIIEFPTPDKDLRQKIWQRTLPAPPNSALSEDELRSIGERFAITGGSIRNIVVDAAFRALAADHSAVVVRDVIDSVAREYQKMGKPITQGDFGETFFRWVVDDILSPRLSD